MVLRVCIGSVCETSMSVGGLSEDEFRQRINEVSKGQIEVIFMLSREIDEKSLDAKIISLRKVKWLPHWLSYLTSSFKNLPTLMKQDIFVVPDINGTGPIACLFCKLFRKKSMITIHGHYEKEWKEIGRYSKMRLMFYDIGEKFTLKFADMIVVNDEQIKEKLIHKGVSPTRVSIRYVFADTETFSRKHSDENKFQEVKSAYTLPDKYVLFVGHLSEWDGIMDVLEVFKKIHAVLPTYKCVLVGGVTVEKELSKSRINSFIVENNFDNEVIQTGKVDHKLMPYFYYGADIIILPLQPPQAGVGRIIVEALSMEIPVIIMDIGIFHRVVVDDETGYRVPLGNTDLMASKAVYLLQNPKLRKKFGLNGRKLVQNEYDADIYIGNWVNSIRSLVSEN